MSAEELEASLLAQVGALWAIARAAGVELGHVKPHGALYNRAATDPGLAECVARAIARFPAELTLVGLAGSALIDAGLEAGLPVAAEAFADRAYEPDGSLRPRSLPGAVHTDPAVAAAQAVSIARDGRVIAHDGSTVEVRADTICLHGDTPDAAAIAKAVREALDTAGIDVRALTAKRG
ncbi:MAG: LamB/YcsF family protein, partial [Candidatus Limnocylindrales bacterium]